MDWKNALLSGVVLKLTLSSATILLVEGVLRSQLCESDRVLGATRAAARDVGAHSPNGQGPGCVSAHLHTTDPVRAAQLPERDSLPWLQRAQPVPVPRHWHADAEGDS